VIYLSIRVLLIVVGAVFAIPNYADMHEQRFSGSRAAVRAARRSLAWAVLFATIASVGVVGWRP
jgi:hypothetical protein